MTKLYKYNFIFENSKLGNQYLIPVVSKKKIITQSQLMNIYDEARKQIGIEEIKIVSYKYCNIIGNGMYELMKEKRR